MLGSSDSANLLYSSVGSWHDLIEMPTKKVPKRSTDRCQVDRVEELCIFRNFHNDLFITSCFSAHSKEKFLSDLRKSRANFEGEKLVEILELLRNRLDDPDVLSVDTVVSMLLSFRFPTSIFIIFRICIIEFLFRDIQNYSAMVQLVEDVATVPNCKIADSPAVKFNYAFALNRFVDNHLG